MEAIKIMISEDQEEVFLREFYRIATKAIEKAEADAGLTKEFLNQKEMSGWLGVSENFLKERVKEGLPVTTLGIRKFYSKKSVTEFMFRKQI